MLHRPMFLATLALALAGMSYAQESPTPSLDDLEQRVKILERQKELEKEAAAAKEKDAAKVTIGSGGFSFASADGSFVLKIRGYVHADTRVWGGDQKVATVDTFTLRRVRPIFEGSLGKLVDFRVMPDFGGGTTVLQDAYIDVKFAPWLKVRSGKFKPPIGLERLQSATDLAFVERALPTNLAPNRDLGVQFFGDLWDGVVGYQAGIFNGTVDLGNTDADVNDSKDIAARVWITPLKKSASWLRDFSFGVVGSEGTNRGTFSATNASVVTASALPSYRSASQLAVFAYRSDSAGAANKSVIAAGDRKRFGVQAQVQSGRIAVQSEWLRSSQEVALLAETADLTHASWQATAQVMLTRDKASLKGFSPKKPFDPSQGQIGAIELALRAGRLDIDEDAFPTFADPGTATKAGQVAGAKEFGVGFNWYLTRNLKVAVDGVRTRFLAFRDALPRETEKVLFSRVQIAF